MKNTPLLAIGIIIILLAVAGLVYFFATPHATAPTTGMATTTTSATTSTTQSVTAQNENQAMYTCESGKTITATFLDSTLPNSRVQLVLSDGRTFTLPQVRSGSGIRYEQGTGTSKDIQFSSEGSNAFLMENGKTTYDNCVAGTVSTGTGGTKTFTDQSKTFSFNYPSEFSISGGGVGYSTDWMINATTSGLLLVKATLPGSFEPKTNFVDATFTVGTSPDPGAVAECLKLNYGNPSSQESAVTINGVTYSRFVTSDAGAGQFYQTTSYRAVRNNQCYAIEYTIHSSNIGNFPPDQGISTFDQQKVENALQGIVQSFKFL